MTDESDRKSVFVYTDKPGPLQFFHIVVERQQQLGAFDVTYGYPLDEIWKANLQFLKDCFAQIVTAHGPQPSRTDLEEMTKSQQWIEQLDRNQVQLFYNGTGDLPACYGSRLNAWDQQQQAEWRQQSLYALFMLVGICLLGAILLTGLAFVLVGIKPKIYALLEETGLDQRLSNFIDAVNSFLENASQKAQQLAQTARETADSAKERVNLLGQKFRLYGHRDQGGYVELVDERGIRKTVTRINESEPGTPTPGTPRASHFGSS